MNSRRIVESAYLSLTGVGVEKLAFHLKWPKFEGQEMSCDQRRSLISHPDAISFSRFFAIYFRTGLESGKTDWGQRAFATPGVINRTVMSGGLDVPATAVIFAMSIASATV